MKRFLFLVFLCLIFFRFSFAQTHRDSLLFLQKAAAMYGLHYTEAQADSLRGHVLFAASIYQRMHKELPPNDLAFTFAFNPAPYGFKVPVRQNKILWEVPTGVLLPKVKDELAFYSIPQLASLIRNRKISSVELTRFFLGRLKKWGDTLNCVVTITEDTALMQAREADQEIRRGIYRGMLHGIPYGLKDLFAVKGYKTTWGATPYKNQVIDQDAFVYTRLKKAGAILCAKLSLGALASGDRWFGGVTRTPWNLQQGSGGSSAGSAAAVAAGLLPFALGTETMGSIVDPSHRCGTTGLRPTFGTISRSGAMVLSWSLDKIGPISRSAEDDAIVYHYLKGTDGRDYAAVNHSFNYRTRPDIRKMRIAYAANYFKSLKNDAPEWRVLKTLKNSGVNLMAVNFPDSAVYTFRMADLILNAESAAAFDDLTRSGRDSLMELQRRGALPNNFRAARYIPAVEYINVNRYRSRLCREIQAFMKNYDVIIVPTYAGNQLKISNLTGNPAVCLPIGFEKGGLPQSITFIGRLYDEASILELAKAYQDRTAYHKWHPEKFKH